MGQVKSCKPQFDTTKGQNAKLNPDWMKTLPDSRSLAEISVPGTHDSASFYGGALVQCQTWPIEAQLKAGMRFLDIRCRHYHNDLPIHHECVYQHRKFHNILDCVQVFLKEYPSETVLIRVRMEYRSAGNDEEFWQTVKKQLAEYQDIFMNINTPHYLPTLGESRGKLIIIQNFNGPLTGIGYLGPLVDVADMWNIPHIFKLKAKWRNVHDHMIKACDNNDKIYITFTSGAGGGAYPNTISKSINKRVLNFLIENPVGKYGLFAFDFPGEQLIELVINSNFT